MVEGAGAEVAAVFGLTKVAALAYLMLNLFTPPCFAAIGAMNAEIKDRRWFWGGIALQLATGYSVGYLVYTIGTLITAPATLNMGAALGGLLFVLAFAGVLRMPLLELLGLNSQVVLVEGAAVGFMALTVFLNRHLGHGNALNHTGIVHQYVYNAKFSLHILHECLHRASSVTSHTLP